MSELTPPPPSSGPKRDKHIGRLAPESVALYIGNEADPVFLILGQDATLGRYSPNNTAQPSLDLMPFGAFDKGVSRLHATLHRTETGTVMLSDRASGNGTYLNGVRLAPFIASKLNSGDRIRLAGLDIQIFFSTDEPVAVPAPAPAADVFVLHRENVVPGQPLPEATLPMISVNQPGVVEGTTTVSPAPSSSALAEATQTGPTQNGTSTGNLPGPTPVRPTEFNAQIDLDLERIFSQTGLIAERLLRRLAKLQGVSVKVVLKIEAETKDGFDEGSVAILSQTAQELKFKSAYFDSGNRQTKLFQQET